MTGYNQFDLEDDDLDEEQVEQWVEQFFTGLLNMLNGFYAQLDLRETLERLKTIPFEDLVLEQLIGESDEVKLIAIRHIRALANQEMAYLGEYAEDKPNEKPS